MNGVWWLLVAALAIAVVALVVGSVALSRARRSHVATTGPEGPRGAAGSVGFTGSTGAAVSPNVDVGFLPIVLTSSLTGLNNSQYNPELIDAWGSVHLLTTGSNSGVTGDVFWVTTQAGVIFKYLFWNDTNTGGTLELLERVVATGPAMTTAPPLSGLTRNVSGTGFEFVGSSGTNTGPADLVAVSEDGLIYAYNAAVDSHLWVVKDNSGLFAQYEGCEVTSDGLRLFVTNFQSGNIEMYDSNWSLITQFTDPQPELVNGVFFMRPYNVRQIDNNIFISFVSSLGSGDPIIIAGNAIMNVFALDGTFIRRFATFDDLNASWEMRKLSAAGSPSGRDELLITNFGDGFILRYDLQSGQYINPIKDQLGHPILNAGAWSTITLFGSKPPFSFIVTQGPAAETAGQLSLLKLVS